MTDIKNITAKMAVPTRYPKFMDMETASPPVSPSVVAAIFIIQKRRVTSGTLLILKCSIFIGGIFSKLLSQIPKLCYLIFFKSKNMNYGNIQVIDVLPLYQ